MRLAAKLLTLSFGALLQCRCAESGGSEAFLAVPPRDGDLRVVTWNVRSGREGSLLAVAEQIAALDADLVALQEVDRNATRTGNVDQPAELGRILGYAVEFVPAIRLDEGDYGIAVLSRVPFQASGQIALSNTGASEARAAFFGVVCPNGHCLSVVNHHADTNQAAALQSVREILDAVEPAIGDGLLFLGDLNQTPGAPGPRACREAGLRDLVGELGEAPSFDGRRLDFIFADSVVARGVQVAGVVRAPESDHHALLADFHLEGR